MTKKLLVSCAMLIISLQLFAQKAEVFSTSEGAIRGYDAVAYFTEGMPVKGKADFSYQWNKATWYFSNEENLSKFKASPEKYAPQFGGYCAFGMSEGHKAPTQPDAWTIVDNKLYLNYNAKVKEKWNDNKEDRIKKADNNWLSLKDKE